MTSFYDPGTYLKASLGQDIYIIIEPGTMGRASFDIINGWRSNEVVVKIIEKNADLR